LSFTVVATFGGYAHNSSVYAIASGWTAGWGFADMIVGS
jgi:hypothetical protein